MILVIMDEWGVISLSSTIDENTFFNKSLDILCHYGVMGMKWGVRNEETLRKYNGGSRLNSAKKKMSEISQKVSYRRQAKKQDPKASFRTKSKAKQDAKEYARAKMFWGEGSGIRRRQIQSIIQQRSRDLSGYDKEFKKYMAKQDMKKHSAKANKERSSIDKTERKRKNRANRKKVASALITSAAGISVVYAYQNPKEVSNFIHKVRNIRL